MFQLRDNVWIYDRDGKQAGVPTGGQRHCKMEGCTGMRIRVRWPDGKITWPCSKGLTLRQDGHWQIG